MECYNCKEREGKILIPFTYHDRNDVYLCEKCNKSACIRCKEQCFYENTVHQKRGLLICNDCYMDDIDFCKVRWCTKIGIRPSGLCSYH